MTDRLKRLEDLVRRLRGPDGCPWDREQKIETLRPYVLEEAHEVAAAIDGGDRRELAAELGDLLFQVVFLSILAEEEGAFDLGQVAERSHQKMVERHPHVFGSETAADSSEVRAQWEQRKSKQSDRSLLEGIPPSLPALVGAYRMTQKAAGVGFDFVEPRDLLNKIEEEIAELKETLEPPLDRPPDQERITDELGDLLFAVANLGRKLAIDPAGALARTNRKFRRRFEYIESTLASQGQELSDSPLEELDRLWEEAKQLEQLEGPSA